MIIKSISVDRGVIVVESRKIVGKLGRDLQAGSCSARRLHESLVSWNIKEVRKHTSGVNNS